MASWFRAHVRLWIAAVACLLFASPVHAQHWGFQTYGADQGLTNPSVRALYQDRQGFIWVSTEGGLFRYDGDGFRSFGAENPSAMLGTIASMHSSNDGQFWIASSVGLFHLAGDRFLAVSGFADANLESGQTIASDATSLYLSTRSGLRSMPLDDPGQQRLVSPKRSRVVFVASDRTVWFGCDDLICSIRDGRLEEWAASRGVTPAAWLAIAEDTAGRLWIRSADKVLMRESAGSDFHAVPNIQSLESTQLSLLVTTRLGEVLIPHRAGLMSCRGHECRNYGPESGLLRTEVFTAVEDREGSLWIGYPGHGLARWRGRAQWQSFGVEEGLTSLVVWRVVRGAGGDMWIGTSEGLFQGVERDGRWQFQRSDAVGELTVYGLAAEPDGSLLIGTLQPGANGLIRYDPRTNKKVVYPPSEPSPQFAITDIEKDHIGTIWVGGRRGVLQLRPGGTRLDPVPSPLDGKAVLQVRATGQGLFIGGKNGLYIQQAQVRRLLTVADGLKEDYVKSVIVDPDGAVWITYSSPVGITRIDVKGDKVELHHLTADDGLPGNVIYSQFFDASGRHWVGTDHGLAVLDGNRWKRYGTSDGLVWDDCNAKAYLAEADGTVWVGTSGGLARFHPTAEPTSALPDTLITSVLRNDVPAQNTDFDASTRSLTLRFTMLSYRRQTVNFRYRMGTTSSAWMTTQSHEIRFAELPAGSYRFEVQGETESGAWSHPAVLQFRIRPPWFLSRPFQTALALLLTSVVWFWWRQREIRQASIRAELEAAVAARTLELGAATARAEQLYEEAQRQAMTDPLTGLYNRRRFFELGEHELRRAARYGESCSVLMLDLDHFKKINDTWGHSVGDKVLATTAAQLSAALRNVDILARFGGEEFVLLVPETAASEARGLAERLCRTVRDYPIPAEKGDVHVTVSIGLTQARQGETSLAGVIERADQALYRAKQSGRDRCVEFAPDQTPFPTAALAAAGSAPMLA